MDHASAPIKYRSIVDVAKMPSLAAEQVCSLPLTHRPALALAVSQGSDGTWGQSMLTVPGARSEGFEGVGTINAVRRLLEYGWDRDTPPLIHSRRVLFRLLAEDEDPELLFELGASAAGDAELARRSRTTLREAAAAALAQAGYEGDPRLRGAAKRILARLCSYLRSPLARQPFVRAGNQHVLAGEAAPPSVYTLVMLAYMPLFRIEHHESMELLYNHIAQPLPRQDALQLCGAKVVAQPHLVLGDRLPNRGVADEDVVAAVTWLELMARLGFLRRNDNWCGLYDCLLDDCDAQGVWRPHKGASVPRTSNPLFWAMYPLEDRASGDERWTDVTFRLGLIGRLLGRTIEVV